MEDFFELLFLLLFIVILATILYWFMDNVFNASFFYLDSNGLEHEADFCSSSYGSFYCIDNETGYKFLVNSYRREYSKVKK